MRAFAPKSGKRAHKQKMKNAAVLAWRLVRSEDGDCQVKKAYGEPKRLTGVIFQKLCEREYLPLRLRGGYHFRII